MIKVFKTNIAKTEEADRITNQLLEFYPNGRITIDLEDCDRVLRVETNHSSDTDIMNAVRSEGYNCEILP